MMTKHCKDESVVFVGISTHSICICLNLGLFAKDCLGHVSIWLTGKWFFYFIQPIYPFWHSSFTGMLWNFPGQ